MFTFEQTRSFFSQKNDTFKVAILKCSNMEVLQKVKKIVELITDKKIEQKLIDVEIL